MKRGAPASLGLGVARVVFFTFAANKLIRPGAARDRDNRRVHGFVERQALALFHALRLHILEG